MNRVLATSDYDDIDVPDESPVGVGTGARRPKDLLTRDQLATLSARSNVQGLIYLVAHFAAIGGTGWLLYLATPGWWALPALLLHAVVISYLFSPVHECCHYTAFRSFWLNEGAYWWCCLFYVMVPNWFRYLHLSHHRYTQMRGQDPEMVLATPSTARQWLWYVSGMPFWWRNFSRILRHATIGPDADDTRGGKYVPGIGTRGWYWRRGFSSRFMQQSGDSPSSMASRYGCCGCGSCLGLLVNRFSACSGSPSTQAVLKMPISWKTLVRR